MFLTLTKISISKKSSDLLFNLISTILAQAFLIILVTLFNEPILFCKVISILAT